MNLKKVLFSLLLACPFVCGAQKIKIDENIILSDKKPVAKIFGETAYAKTDFKILSLTDEPLLSISRHRFFLQENPFLGSLAWYKIRFEDTGNTINVFHSGDCNAKCVIKNYLIGNGIPVDGTPIKDQESIAKRLDITEKVNKDTLEMISNHQLWTGLLGKNAILRDTEKPIVLMKTGQTRDDVRGVTVTSFNIAQDNIVIGKVIKQHEQNSYRNVVTYEVYEKLYQPENGLDHVPSAKVTNYFADEISLQTVADGQVHVLKTTNMFNAEIFLCKYLVSRKYL